MLRREKKDVELSLPPKKEILIYAPLSLKQQHMYKDCLNYSLGPLKNHSKNDPSKVRSDWSPRLVSSNNG